MTTYSATIKLLFVCVLLLCQGIAYGQTKSAQHNDQKTTFLLKTANHFDWPAEALADSFRILVLKNSQLKGQIQQAAEPPFELQGLPVSVASQLDTSSWADFNLVYLPQSQHSLIEQLQKASINKGTMVVGDGFDFGTYMLNIHELKYNELGYDLNERLIEDAGIQSDGNPALGIEELSKREWEKRRSTTKTNQWENNVFALYNIGFLKYTLWPEGSLNDDELKLAIVQDSAVYRSIQKVFEQQPNVQDIQGRTIKPKLIDNVDQLANYDAVYVDYASEIPAKVLLDEIGKKSILLMTYGYGYNETMLNIFLDGQTVRFQVNQDQAEAHGLKFRSALYTEASEANEEDWKDLVSHYHQKLDKEKEKNKVLRSEVSSLNEAMDSLRQNIALLETEIDQRSLELIKIQGQITEQRGLFQAMEDDLAVKVGELQNAKDDVTSMEQAVKVKEMELLDSENKLKNQRGQLENLVKDYDAVEAKMSDALKLLDNQRAVIYGMILIALIFILLSGVAYNNYRKQRQHAKVIAEQKHQVENQRDQIKEKSLQIEEKNREITDSITYAKRIQDAILPPEKMVDEYLNENFIFFKPKDIVAGDFYWLEPVGDLVYFAAADCTGHGVPGAMVSVLCNNGLNRAVREFGLRKPGEILNKTRELVIQEFEKSEEDVKDGMDIAFCTFDRSSHKLEFAGAQNPLWIISKHAEISGEADFKPPYSVDDLPGIYLHEVKADKEPIGKYASQQPFSNHQVQLNKGDVIYLFSDGYADQFGGDRGKKLKYRPFKDLLMSHYSLPMEKQHELIADHFEEWRGDLDQIDDVVVFGVRV